MRLSFSILILDLTKGRLNPLIGSAAEEEVDPAVVTSRGVVCWYKGPPELHRRTRMIDLRS